MLFEVIAAEEQDSQVATRKAINLAEARVEQKLGDWLRQGNVETFNAYYSMVEEQFDGIVKVACEEVGCLNDKAVAKTLLAHYAPRTARRPWEDEDDDHGPADSDYEGDSEHDHYMNDLQRSENEGGATEEEDEEDKTSSFTEKMASNITNVTPLVGGHFLAHDAKEADRQEVNPSNQDGSTKTVPCPQCGGDGKTAGNKDCSRCAGHGKVSDWGPSVLDKLEGKTATEGITDLGPGEPTIRKEKWTPQNVKKYKEESTRWPTKEKDPIEAIKADNESELTEIGEKTTEQQKLPTGTGLDGGGFATGGEDKGPATKTFPKGKQADPVTNPTLSKVAWGEGQQYEEEARDGGMEPSGIQGWGPGHHVDTPEAMADEYIPTEEEVRELEAQGMARGQAIEYLHGVRPEPGGGEPMDLRNHPRIRGAKTADLGEMASPHHPVEVNGATCPNCRGTGQGPQGWCEDCGGSGKSPMRTEWTPEQIGHEPHPEVNQLADMLRDEGYYSKTAGEGDTSYPPQGGGFPGETPAPSPYNPGVNDELVSGLHPAAQMVYQRARQQGISPDEALQSAQQQQQQVQKGMTQGIGYEGQDRPVVGLQPTGNVVPRSVIARELSRKAN